MKSRGLLIFFAAIILLWLGLGLFLIYGFAPLDFYGEGAWYAQGVLRWETEGWPGSPMGGSFIEEFGFGAFTLWIYFSLLMLFFKLLGFKLSSMLYLSLFSTAITGFLLGLLLKRLAPGRGFWAGFFFLLFVLSPLPFVISHTARPIGLAELWLTGCVVLILLPEGGWIRKLGFFILPMGFWIHQLGGVIALCLLLAMALVFITRRKYGPETLWLLAGGVLVAGTSIVVPWMAGKLSIFQEIVIHYNKSIGPKPLLSSLYISVSVALAGAIFLLWPLRKARLDLDKTLIALITVGVLLLPVVFGMRPRRVFQFIYPLLWFLLYIGFLYAEQLGRLFKYGFLAVVLAGMCFYWWRSRDALYVTMKNPEYMRKAEAFMERNRPLIDSSEKVFMALHGEGYLFWLLPREKQVGVRPYFRGPAGKNELVLITDYELRGIPYLQPVDSINPGFVYSFYGSRPFRKIYLCRGRGG